MTALLDDKRLEVAAQMLAAWFNDVDEKYGINAARNQMSGEVESARAMLSEAIKQTHADKLAEALERCIPILENLDTIRHIAPEFPVLDNARAALDAFKEIANG